MNNTARQQVRTEHFSRARAYRIAKSLTASKIVWVEFRGGEHVFTCSGSQVILVDLVIGKARYA
jgi:hypothetical protein